MTVDLEGVQRNVTRAAEYGFTDAELSNVRAAFLEARADGFEPELRTWLESEHSTLVPLLDDPDAVDTFQGPRQGDDLRVQPTGPLSEDAGELLRAGIDLAGFESEYAPVQSSEEFLAALGAPSEDHRRAIEALQSDEAFAELWNWFEEFPGGNPIVMTNVPGLDRGDGTEVFGLYVWDEMAVAINSTHPDHIENPMELVDTVVHELIHAALDVAEHAEAQGLTVPDLPLPDGVYDWFRDPWLATDQRPDYFSEVATESRAFVDASYRQGLSNPGEYLDINPGAEAYIRGIIGRLIDKTGIGSPTHIFNERLPPVPPRDRSSMSSGLNAPAGVDLGGGIGVNTNNEATIELPGIEFTPEGRRRAIEDLQRWRNGSFRVQRQGGSAYVERALGRDRAGTVWRDVGESFIRRGYGSPSPEKHPRKEFYHQLRSN
ncbi:MAG: hypothetical protein AAF654_05685 [Myxococcota bacterium]